jgi:nuclear pore complex protein Nup205
LSIFPALLLHIVVFAFYDWDCLKLHIVFVAGGTQLGTVSWEHFFASLNQYYANLRQEVPQSNFSNYGKSTPFRMHGAPMAAVRSITPQEVDGLRAVLGLIGTIIKQVILVTTLICVV